jgi:hypothetical protein
MNLDQIMGVVYYVALFALVAPLVLATRHIRAAALRHAIVWFAIGALLIAAYGLFGR